MPKDNKQGKITHVHVLDAALLGIAQSFFNGCMGSGAKPDDAAAEAFNQAEIFLSEAEARGAVKVDRENTETK